MGEEGQRSGSSEVHQNDEDGKVLMEEAHIRSRWQKYFHRHLNEEKDMDIVLGYLEHFKSHQDCEYCRWVKIVEVEWVIHKMSRGSAPRPEEIPIEF